LIWFAGLFEEPSFLFISRPAIEGFLILKNARPHLLKALAKASRMLLFIVFGGCLRLL
jgi:hypothetical protein